VDRLVLVRGGLELTAVTAMTLEAVARAVCWDDVATELARSCEARALPGTYHEAPGVVGVLSGAAPLVWVHGRTDAASLAATLAAAPDVVEVHVRHDLDDVAAALGTIGWRTASVVTQLVHDGAVAGEPVPDGYTVEALTVADLPEFRALLRTASDATEAMLDVCFGDDFFVKAAPAWLFGARDASGALAGVIGVRRQQRAAMLFALAVAPEHRGSGIGRTLAAAAVAQANEAGAEFSHAVAEPEALLLALSCGFRRVGTWLRLEMGD
jgi:GNAT superfamily N-acetyltransferase